MVQMVEKDALAGERGGPNERAPKKQCFTVKFQGRDTVVYRSLESRHIRNWYFRSMNS